MSFTFTTKDIIHRITVKFVESFLPTAKKKYHAKVVLQPRLDIHGIASKAGIYSIGVDPKVIEDGLTAGLELIRYLVSDGYVIDTPLFNLYLRIPGEYDGSETHLPPDTYPRISATFDKSFRQYIRDHVHVNFDGVDDTNGYIGETKDMTTGDISQTVTIGGVLIIRGYGLKVEADDEHASNVGVYFEPVSGIGKRVAAKVLIVNEPRTLTILADDSLVAHTAYTIAIYTQASAKTRSRLLKDVREVRSEFQVTAISKPLPVGNQE
jgi:hypothetical protein